MEELREVFIRHLTEDIDPKIASAIFDIDGQSNWSCITLDMIMKIFDKAINEFMKSS